MTLLDGPSTGTGTAVSPTVPAGWHVRHPAWWFKYAIDLFAALALLVALSPLMAITALAIVIDDRGPVFYRQERVGYRGRVFRVWKFRTMRVGAHAMLDQLLPENDGDGLLLFKLRSDPRVTRVGRVIRRLSLDELPQLINVLVGQMSLVGPRPLPGKDIESYSAEARRRFQVRPGITGLWQVSGRSDLDWNRTVEIDLTYVDTWSLRLDAVILLRTLPAVVAGTGAY